MNCPVELSRELAAPNISSDKFNTSSVDIACRQLESVAEHGSCEIMKLFRVLKVEVLRKP